VELLTHLRSHLSSPLCGEFMGCGVRLLVNKSESEVVCARISCECKIMASRDMWSVRLRKGSTR